MKKQKETLHDRFQRKHRMVCYHYQDHKNVYSMIIMLVVWLLPYLGLEWYVVHCFGHESGVLWMFLGILCCILPVIPIFAFLEHYDKNDRDEQRRMRYTPYSTEDWCDP